MGRVSKQKTTKEHHNLSTTVMVHEEKNVNQLTIENSYLFTEESNDFFKLV